MRSWLLYILVLLWNLSPAQQYNYTFTNYTTANGLADNTVNTILQDSRGFLWFGTREGLSRFDGTNFRNYFAGKNVSSSLPGNSVAFLAEYKPGMLLIVAGGTITTLNTVTGQFAPVGGFQNKTVYFIRRLSKDRYAVSVPDSCFIINERLAITDTVIPPLKYRPAIPHVVYISEDKWLTGSVEEYFLYDRGKKNYALFGNRDYYGRENALVFQYYDPVNQWLYLSNYYHGLFRYSIDGAVLRSWKRGNLPDHLPDCNIRFVVPKNDSILWIGGAESGGLMILNTVTDHFSQLNHNSNFSSSLAGNSLSYYYTDRDRNEWLASTAGVSKLAATAGIINSWRESFPGNTTGDVLVNVLKGADQQVYVSAFGTNRCYRIEPLSGKVSMLDPAQLPQTWSISSLGNELVFTGSGPFISRFSPLTGRYTQTDFLKKYFPVSDVIILAFRQRNGDEWYSGNNGGGFVRVSAKDGSIHHYRKDGPAGSFSISYYANYAEDRNGDCWFGVNKSNRLLHWDHLRDRFTEISFDTIKGTEGVVFSGITDMTLDGENKLWIAFDGSGILQFDPAKKKTVHYTIQDGLPTNFIFALRFDDRNRLWIGTTRGLSCLLVKESKFLNFTREDGLPSDYFDERTLYFDSTIRQFWAGSKNTLMRFDPDTLLATAGKQFPVYIDEISVNGRNYPAENPDPLSFSPSQNNLQLRFIALDINSGKNIEYSYRLSGADKDWIYNGSAQTASYANLPPGKYTFTVRARHKGDTAWKEMQQPLRFSIATPWNKTWWFRSLAAAFVLLFSWLAIRVYYRRKMEKQQVIMEKEIAIEQERTKMARELHDGLGSMLSGIKHSFAAMNKEFSLTEKQQTLFHANLDKLNESIVELRNISHNMASDALLKYGIENSLRDYCNNTSAASGISITYTTLNTEKLKLGEERSFHVFRVMQELLQNIIKHSAATQVLVQLSCNNNLLYIAVEDDGKGFDIQEAKKQKSMGLKNIESRIKLLKGHLDYQTSPGEGTSVLISIPVD